MIPGMLVADAERECELKLNRAFGGIVADLAAFVSAAGPVPTLMVAANESGADTTGVALALADVAAERGMRVLVVEGARPRSVLAGAADLDGIPALVEAFESLRIMLPAEWVDGVFLAPHLANGAGIAAALARNAQARLVDDLGATFDIVLIDGGRAGDIAASGWYADAYLRVGRFTSGRDTELFLQTLRVPAEAFVGSIAASTFIPADGVRRPRLSLVPAAPWPHPVQDDGASRPLPAALRSAYPRRVAIR